MEELNSMSTLTTAELVGNSAKRWNDLRFEKQQEILELSFIRRFVRNCLYFESGNRRADIERKLERKLRSIE